MNNRISTIACALLLATGLFSCKKDKDNAAEFQALTFKFGADAAAITIDNAVQEIKNLPRGYDLTKLTAAAVLPAGYSISPDPATVADYTKGVTFTVKTDQGKTYSVQLTAPVYDAVKNPYGIYTPKHLNDIRKGLNDSYVLMNDIELPALSAANSAATVGISDYNDYGWYSIGTKYIDGGHVIFRGSLDGQNHVIKNFTSLYRDNNQPDKIDEGHRYRSNSGLFGYAIKATFKNIGIQLAATGVNELNRDTTAGLSNIGSMAGYTDSCTFTNCYVTGTAKVWGRQYSGGLIGTASNATISKCYAAITAPVGSTAIFSYEGGGLIGNAFNSEISDSYATGSIFGGANSGGLIGSINSCTVKTSYASGNVVEAPLIGSSSLIAPNAVGGLIGSVNASTNVPSKIQNCYATGAVTGAVIGANGIPINVDYHKTTRIGGLVGQISTSATGTIQVSNCFASGMVSRVHTSATAPFLTGGLVGTTHNGVFITSGTCTNYWDKTTTGQTNLGGGNGSLAQDNAFTINGKATAEMKATATYANWNFSSIWDVASGTNNGYPYLRSTK